MDAQTIEMLLHPKEFSSNYTFKKSILSHVPVIFSGNKTDFDFYLREQLENLDFTKYE